MDKKRQQMNRRIALEKLASAKTMRYQGKESPLFDDSDLKIDHPKAISEGGKHYLNMLSELDNIDPYKEYIEAGQGKRSKVSDKSSLLINDDEYDDFVEDFIRKPSRLDKKYREPDVNAKPDRKDKREDIWDNDDFCYRIVTTIFQLWQKRNRQFPLSKLGHIQRRIMRSKLTAHMRLLRILQIGRS